MPQGIGNPENFRISPKGNLRGETAKLLPGSKNKPKVRGTSWTFVKSSSLESNGNV